MKRRARMLVAGMIFAGMFGAAFPRCAAEAVCDRASVKTRVEAAKGELTLADLLTRDSCRQLRQAAAQVNLGEVPRAGGVRVFAGAEVRQMLESLGDIELRDIDLRKKIVLKIPERILVRPAAETKSCGEISRFVANSMSLHDVPTAMSRRESEMNCAAAPAISKDTALELSKGAWNNVLRRWEFTLRCAQAMECVPFLVWISESKAPPVAGGGESFSRSRLLMQKDSGAVHLVKPGQNAMLTWEQGGIRVVLPVTCLDAGGLGESVRVRFKNAPTVMRAEVVGTGRLRASL